MNKALAELFRCIVEYRIEPDIDEEFAKVVAERQELEEELESESSPNSDYLVLEHLCSCGQVIAS